MGEELKEDIDRDTGIEEGEADHRINEFRDLVRRLENIESGIMDGFARLESGIKEGFARLVERMGAVASIAVDNGAAPWTRRRPASASASPGADGNGKSGCGRRFPGGVLGRPGRGFGYLRR